MQEAHIYEKNGCLGVVDKLKGLQGSDLDQIRHRRFKRSPKLLLNECLSSEGFSIAVHVKKSRKVDRLNGA